MSIAKHLDKDNLHHAYLIEGMREEIVPEILKFLGGTEVVHITLDTFKIDDARNLKSYSFEKSLESSKRIFVISANSFLLEAQNSLLKLFEDPIPNTHFFLIVPDTSALLKTLVSRFYLIKTEYENISETKQAEQFISMPLKNRIDFIKELLAEPEEEDESAVLDSTRSKALKFLNNLENYLHSKFVKNFSGHASCFEHLFKVREFLRMPGSSAKSLMEGVALVVPKL